MRAFRIAGFKNAVSGGDDAARDVDAQHIGAKNIGAKIIGAKIIGAKPRRRQVVVPPPHPRSTPLSPLNLAC